MYIVDIDGTIADLSHRLHYIKGAHKNYEKFFDAMVDDEPIHDVIRVVNNLHDSGYRIVFVSGRPDSHRKVTVEFIIDNFSNIFSEDEVDLRMRKAGDHHSDVIVKSEILDEILRDYHIPVSAIIGAFDDRPSIVNLWRSKGITVFKVGDWDNEQEGRVKRLRAPTLTMMIGPSGAGKSTWIAECVEHRVVSTDNLCQELLGDFKRQDENDAIFQVAHKLTKTYLDSGLDVVFDATNLRNKDRKAVLRIAPLDCKIEYIVINRPMQEKIDTRGWRSVSLLDRHEQTFKSNLKDILRGDGDDRVVVKNLIQE